MKKIILLTSMLLCSLVVFANYTGTVTTSQSELTFSTKNGYNVVSLKGNQYTNTIGHPEMPVKTLSFLIPIDQKVSSIVINNTTVQQISGNYTIYPVQTPVPNTPATASAGFDNPDPSIYNSTNPYPGITYSTKSDGYPMGYHVVTINFYPVQFIPANHILNLYTSINFTIVYASNTNAVLRPNRQSVYSNNLSKTYIKSMVANPNDLSTVTGGAREVVINTGTSTQNIRGMSPTNLNSIPDYIIITSNALIGTSTTGFQKLADWKTQKGVNTMIVKIQDIYSNYPGYDNAEKIRNYLKDVYLNFGSSYVLLGGDVKDGSGIELIPTRFAYIEPDPYTGLPVFKETDYYYATVQNYWNDDGDNLFGENSDSPDMEMAFLVGRAPVRTITEASNFSNKIIRYENLKDTNNVQLSNINYVKNLSYWLGLTKAHGPYGPFAYTNLDAMNAMNEPSGLIPSPKYRLLKLYDSTETYPGSFVINSTQAKNSLNTGWATFGQSYGMNHIFYHLDHSGPEGMSTGSTIGGGGVGVGDMDALTKGSYYGIFYSDGCDVNSFASDNSVSKHYLNKINGGGVAFIGNTSYGWGGDDATFRTFFMDALYSDTKLSGLQKYDNGNYRMGYLNWYSAYPEGPRYLKSKALVGDPEMMVWTDAPQTLGLTATYSAANKNITGTISGLTFVATPTVVVTITAWKGTEIWQTKDINATTASVAYTLSNVLAHTTGNITVTATAHNYIPKVNTINVSSISGAHPYMLSYVIDDDNTGGSAGNSDAFPDAGETIQLPVSLKNSGSATASTVTARLTWKAAPYQTQSGANATITINPTYSVSAYGNITAGQTVTNTSSPFRFTVNKNAFDNMSPRPLTQFIKFALTTLINGVTFSTDTFIIQITEPHLVKGENTVTGTLAAGSSNQLKIKLYNKGLSTASNLTTSTLSKTSANITLTNAGSAYPNITGVNTANNFGSNNTAYTFTLTNTYTPTQTFTLTVTNTLGKTWTFPNFNLSKPVINTAVSKIAHFGYSASIEPFWNIALTTTVAIQGYNLYKSLTSAGTYSIQNTNILPYASYLDKNVLPLTQYYYKVTVVDINGNESSPYPAGGYLASTTIPIHATTLPSPGWPVTPEPTSNSTTGGRCEGSPITYDLQEDLTGSKEIFFTSGFDQVGGVWAFKNDGSRWYSIAPLITGYIDLHKGTSASPAIADIDNDGQTELAVTHGGSQLFAYKTTMAPVAPSNQPNFPLSVSGSSVAKGVVYSDIDNDGKLEIIRSSDNDLKVFNSDGTVHAGWTNITGYNCGFSMPVAFDFNGDGKKEIVVGCTGNGARPAGLYIFKEDGTNYGASNPVYNALASGDRCDFPPVVADINNDGSYDVLFISAQGTTAKIFAFNPQPSPLTGSLVTGWNNSNHQFTITSIDLGACPNGVGTNNSSTTCTCCGLFSGNLSVGDLNKDGNLEVVAGNGGILHVWDKAGVLKCDITIPIGYTTNAYKTPIIADVDGFPSDLEVIVSGKAPDPSPGSSIYAFKIDLTQQPSLVSNAKGFPISIPEAIGNSPCVDDIDNNQKNELIVTTGTKFYVWDSPGASVNNVYGWTSYRHDNLNSGVFNSADGGLVIGNDNYLQNITISTNTNNLFRYYTGQNILAGYDVTNKKTFGDVLFMNNGTNIILEGTNSVLLKNNITIPVGCTFEIR